MQPIYMPFAGSIRPDVHTLLRLTYCTNAMAGHFFGYIIDSINQLFSITAGNLERWQLPHCDSGYDFENADVYALGLRQQLSRKPPVRQVYLSITLIKIRDVLKRFVGEGYIGAFSVNAIVDFIWSFVTLFIVS
jgi:hypothetical protein